MPSKQRLALFVATLIVASVSLFISSPTYAAKRWNVLYSFCPGGGNCTDGTNPDAGVIFDAAGNLYGTTQFGPNFGGTVFELARGTDGTWSETVLHSFCLSQENCPDGEEPEAGVIFDAAGNLYGTTVYGGANNDGVVFELTPGTNGSWTEKVLHSFAFDGKDGVSPYGGLVFDAAGNLYGTTAVGGIRNGGIVFELTPGPDGNWTEKVLHSFEEPGHYQAGPFGGLAIDASGNLYGTTYGGGIVSDNCAPSSGGSSGCGRVFELTPGANGDWSEKTLYRFRGSPDGANPDAGVVLDSAGNLYGTTYYGGTGAYGNIGYGTVFRLTPKVNGGWAEKVIHEFGVSQDDGYNPLAGLTIDTAGNLYGTTWNGGRGDGGTVFELTPDANGRWQERRLHHWGYTCEYGCGPTAGVILDSAGNVYGTTYFGGDLSFCCGTVFEVTASPSRGGQKQKLGAPGSRPGSGR